MATMTGPNLIPFAQGVQKYGLGYHVTYYAVMRGEVSGVKRLGRWWVSERELAEYAVRLTAKRNARSVRTGRPTTEVHHDGSGRRRTGT